MPGKSGLHASGEGERMSPLFFEGSLPGKLSTSIVMRSLLDPEIKTKLTFQGHGGLQKRKVV